MQKLSTNNYKICLYFIVNIKPYDKLILMTNKQNWSPDYNLVYKID